MSIDDGIRGQGMRGLQMRELGMGEPGMREPGTGVAATRSALSRRGFLAAGGAAAMALGSVAAAPAAPRDAGRPGARGERGRRAKNVIFMVADGMSHSTFSMADQAIRRRGGSGSAWIALWGEPGVRRALCRTSSADSIVTDSAAAASAWGGGVHVNNGALNVHEGREIEPILVRAKRAGKATGLVTTTTVTHATPAGFIANIAGRDDEAGVARQILERGVDVALGGGLRFFKPELLAAHADVRVVNDAAGLRAAASEPGRLLGLFSPGHMSFAVDREETQPHLREMSMTAIERLASSAAGSAEGFVLQIEGGRVDHGGHGNDAAACLHDQIAFDETIAAVTAWARERDDTLVIITTDHGCGGPSLTLYNEEGARGFDRLMNAKKSVTWARDQAKEGTPTERAAAFAAAAREAFAAELTAEDTAWLAGAYEKGARSDGFLEASKADFAAAAVLANHLAVAFVSPNHTSEHVEVTAMGPGAERIDVRRAGPIIDNIDLHGVMLGAMALV